MANFAYYDQLEQKINTLLADKKFKEAFSLCKECIVQFPNESRFTKIKLKIEKIVAEENAKIIEDKLEEIKPLWKQEKYVDILKILRNLINASPDNSKLKKLYSEAEEAYRKQFEKLNEEFTKQQHERLDQVLKNNPGQLLEDLYIIEKENPGNQSIKKLVTEYQDKLIAKKIEDKSELINSNKFDVIENFLDELRKIDKFNKRISHLEESIKSRKLEGEITQAKEFIYGGEKYLDTLMKLKKYDKAIKAAEEILKIDPKDEEARKILDTAQIKYRNQLKYLAAESIAKNLPTLKEEYLKDKTKFIKI